MLCRGVNYKDACVKTLLGCDVAMAYEGKVEEIE